MTTEKSGQILLKKTQYRIS